MPESNLECPCGGGMYERCCAPFHRDESAAPSAELLMRSRYSAYVLGLSDYILKTWYPATRPAFLDLTADAANTRWLGLSVKRHTLQGNNAAEVEFVARFKTLGTLGGGKAQRLHERSRFCREAGRWYYIDGQIDA